MFPARLLAALTTGTLLALGPTAAPAVARVAVPVNCSHSPVELRWDDTTYELEGPCGVVRVLADDVVVRMPTATRLVVRGQRNDVVAKPVGRLVVRGGDHGIRVPSVRALDVASRGSLVETEGLVERLRLGGHGAAVTADRVYTLRAPGSHNSLRTRRGYDAGIGGDANTVHYRRLDALVVRGDHNAVSVRRGATSVRTSGRGNDVDVARRR